MKYMNTSSLTRPQYAHEPNNEALKASELVAACLACTERRWSFSQILRASWAVRQTQ